jgi:hypothetical protein
MSCLSYMTNHYPHAINDHANATKATTYIKHYKYKKSSLKSQTTENETPNRLVENILFFQPLKSSE